MYRHRETRRATGKPQKKSGHDGRILLDSERDRGDQVATAVLSRDAYQVQVMSPSTDVLQTLVVSECVAVAVHVAGGPITAVAVTVTFCE